MRNAWAIFTAELRNVFSNVVTILITIGLVMMPSLFGWFNELACWDVFDNMGNLEIAVANTDEGYKSDLFPLEVNVGEQVVTALRENDQIDWVIVDEEEAIDGARSGAYYAAIVIPANFSQAMLTFYQQDAESAQIIYYTNEKKNAIAPKFTTAGAESVSSQINEVFAETLADISLNIADSVAEYADSDEALSAASSLASSIDTLGTRMDEASNVLSMYAQLASSAQQIASSSADLVDATRTNAHDAVTAVEDGVGAAQNTIEVLSAASAEMSDALSQSVQSIQALMEKLLRGEGVGDVDAAVAALDDQIAAIRDVQTALQAGADRAAYAEHAEEAEEYAQAAAAAEAAVTELAALRDTLAAQDGVYADTEAMQTQAEAATASLEDLKARFSGDVQAQVQELAERIDSLSGSLSAATTSLDQSTSDLSNALTAAADGVGDAAGSLSHAAGKLSTAASALHELASEIQSALSLNDRAQLQALLGSNADSLASAFAAPVAIERTAVYPVENFGSAMTPFYSTLALFIGALVAMVAIRPRPSRRVLEGLGPEANVRLHEEFAGHFGIVAVVAFAQATLLALGNLFFLQVQVAHPLLFLACYWVIAEVFAFIMYALVVSFANLGKGIGVILLIAQVTGCGGSYPLAILPSFIQGISPYLPATHAVSAMRAAMFGLTGSDFYVELGILLLFAVPALVLGLLLRTYTMRFMDWYASRVDDSKLMA